MLYCSNVKDLTFQDEATYRHRVLRDLNIKVLAMMRDQAHKGFKNPLKQPLMKLKVFADELNLVFTPITYVHLVNISKCLQVQDSHSKESEQGLVQERFRLFENAKSLDMVKMKNNMNLMWKPYLAVISGSYIYFFNVEHKDQVKNIMKFIQKQNLKKKWQKKAQTFDDHQFLQKKKFQDLLRYRSIYNALKDVDYQEYFLLKGCSKT